MSNQKASMHDQVANRCKHFTGLTQPHCGVGVLYDDVMDTSKQPYTFPCVKSDNCASRCARVSYPTEAEVVQKVQEIEACGSSRLDAIKNNLCPVCAQPMERQQIVRHWIYAFPCGHRLGMAR